MNFFYFSLFFKNTKFLFLDKIIFKLVNGQRQFKHSLEIVRCLIYLILDYFLITPNQTATTTGSIHINVYLFINYIQCLLRIIHIASIIFWLFYLFPVKYFRQNIFNGINFPDDNNKQEPTDNRKIDSDEQRARVPVKKHLHENFPSLSLSLFNGNTHSPSPLTILLMAMLLFIGFIPFLAAYSFTIPSCFQLYSIYFLKH